MRIVALLICAHFGCLASARAAAQYSAQLLPSDNFYDTRGYDAFGESQAGFGTVPDRGDHAILWTADGLIDLHPAGYEQSRVRGMFGNNQVGEGSFDGWDHALLWSGSPDRAIDLHPTGFRSSSARDIWGSNQVGIGHTAALGESHALLWRGIADSVVDLHPPGFRLTDATDVYESTQVGYGVGTATSGQSHALLWNDSADSVVDLNPVGSTESYAFGVWGDTQIGYARNQSDKQSHAVLWKGSAESFVDLHPSGYLSSYAFGIFGERQVGGASTLGNGHAMVWHGSAATAVDLHQYLAGLEPAFTNSEALSVDEAGNVIGYGYDGKFFYAIRWSVVPEPEGLAITLGAAFCTALIPGRRPWNMA
jgi:hypothetical protein